MFSSSILHSWKCFSAWLSCVKVAGSRKGMSLKTTSYCQTLNLFIMNSHFMRLNWLPPFLCRYPAMETPPGMVRRFWAPMARIGTGQTTSGDAMVLQEGREEDVIVTSGVTQDHGNVRLNPSRPLLKNWDIWSSNYISSHTENYKALRELRAFKKNA